MRRQVDAVDVAHRADVSWPAQSVGVPPNPAVEAAHRPDGRRRPYACLLRAAAVVGEWRDSPLLCVSAS